ncbi:MAG: folE2 [Verrucomicrobiales bacterium]|nr:folE2 [Verrucomicrobiales bacterium]
MLPLEDTQSQPDQRQVRIPKVGIRGLRYPLTIQRPDGSRFPASALASLTADLPATERGTHMSRFVTLLHERRDGLTPAGMLTMVRELRARLHATEAQIILTMPWFIEKMAPVTGAPGFLDYQVTWDASISGDHARLITTVVVPIATVCPCSKAISDRGAHNQRGELTFAAEGTSQLWPDDLIRLAENSASCELYSVLKRPDEKAVTEQAYDNPVFVEDVVRNATVLARNSPHINAFRVEAENFESIHHHNAYAMVEEGW